MKKLVIAVDCDDVLVASTEKIVAMYNRAYGTEVTLENAHMSGNPEWKASRDVTLDRIYQIQLTDEYAQAAPYEGAIAAIEALARAHELHLVTARSEQIMPVTTAMVENYFPSCFTSLHHVGHGRDKGEACKKIGAEVLVDDNEKHLKSANEHGTEHLLLFGSYPWNNKATEMESVKKCTNWDDVEREVARIAGI